MSFFDSYKDLGGGGSYMKSDEKQVLIENGVPFSINSLQMDEENQYGPRYVAFCTIPNLTDPKGDEEERKIAFPVSSGADSRDAMLKAMDEFLKNGGEPVKVKLSKPGRAILIQPAE